MTKMLDRIYERIEEIMGESVAREFKDDETMSVEINLEGFFPEIKSLTVPYSRRGQGLGRKLLAATCQALKEAGYNRVGLYAFPYSYGEGNSMEEIKDLMQWYEKQGFEWAGYETLEDIEARLQEKYGEHWDGIMSFEDVKDAVWMEKEL